MARWHGGGHRMAALEEPCAVAWWQGGGGHLRRCGGIKLGCKAFVGG